VWVEGYYLHMENRCVQVHMTEEESRVIQYREQQKEGMQNLQQKQLNNQSLQGKALQAKITHLPRGFSRIRSLRRFIQSPVSCHRNCCKCGQAVSQNFKS